MKNSQLEFFSFFLTTLTLPSESHYFTRLVIVNFRCLDHLSPFEKASYLEMELFLNSFYYKYHASYTFFDEIKFILTADENQANK